MSDERASTCDGRRREVVEVMSPVARVGGGVLGQVS